MPPTSLPSWPLLGAWPAYRRDPLGFVTRAAREHGDFVRYRLGHARVLQLNHPAAVEEVLIKRQGDTIKDDITRRLSSLLGQGLLTSEGALWRRQRRVVAPALAPGTLKAHAGPMVEAAADWAAGVAHDQVRDVHADMLALAGRVVLRTLLGSEVALDWSRVGAAIEVWLREFMVESEGWRRLLPRPLPTPGRLRARRAARTLHRQVRRVIRDRREHGQAGPDVLWRLLEARDEAGRRISERQLRDEVITFFVAGHETTALALTYALWLLARHPGVTSALRAEVDRVLGDRPATAADLDRLPATRAVILETLRLYPPAWAIGREAVRPLSVSGQRVGRGDQIFIAPWVLHRDPRWFPEPALFQPDRWLDARARAVPKLAYLPFGAGPRLCVGQHFAMLESVLVLATVVQRLNPALVDGAPLHLVPAVTLRPEGPVPLRLLRRPTAPRPLPRPMPEPPQPGV